MPGKEAGWAMTPDQEREDRLTRAGIKQLKTGGPTGGPLMTRGATTKAMSSAYETSDVVPRKGSE